MIPNIITSKIYNNKITGNIQGISSPIKSSLISMAIDFGISGIISAIERQKELKKMQIENAKLAAQSSEAESEEIQNLMTNYSQLAQEVSNNNEQKISMSNLQNNYLRQLGFEENQIENLIKKYGSLEEATQKAIISKLQLNESDLYINAGLAKKDLLTTSDNGKNYSHIERINIPAQSPNDIYTKLEEIINKKQLNNAFLNLGNGMDSIELKNPTNTPEGIKSNIETLEALIVALNEAYSSIDKIEELTSSDLYLDLTSRINILNQEYEKYLNANKEVNTNQAQQLIYPYIFSNDIPESLDKFDEFKQKIIDAATESGKFLGTQEEITDAINDTLSVLPTFARFYGNSAPASSFSFLENTDIGKQLNEIKAKFEDGEFTYKQYFDSLQDCFDNIDLSKYTSSVEDANNLTKQLFLGSVEESANFLTKLIDDFNSGTIDVTDYLDGYSAIAENLNSLTDSLQNNNEQWLTNQEALDSSTSNQLDNYQEQLSNAITQINTFKDSLKSLSALSSGEFLTGTSEYEDNINVIAEALSHVVNTNGDMAEKIKEKLGTTTSEIASSMTGSVENQAIAAEIIVANTNIAISNMAKSIGDLFTVLGEQISKFHVDLTFKPTFKDGELNLSVDARSDSLSAIGTAIKNVGKTINESAKNQFLTVEDLGFNKSGYSPKSKSSSGNNNYKENAKDAENSIRNSANSAKDSVKDAAEEAKKALDELIKKFDELEKGHDLRLSLFTDRDDKIKDSIKLLESQGNQVGKAFYDELINSQNKQIQILTQKRSDLEAYLNDSVSSGKIDVGTEQWFKMTQAVEDTKDEIMKCTLNVEEFQNKINELHWKQFDNFIDRLDGLDSEISNIQDILSKKDLVEEDTGEWTKEGITTLALYGQAYELAIFEAQQYSDEIKKLEDAYKRGEYSSTEYQEKLQDLTDKQWESIKAAEKAKEGIIDLNKARVDAAKKGIEKEIKATEELIDKKKEALDIEKESHDFQNSVAEKQDEIYKLQRQLNGLATDDSQEAAAKKKKIQAQLTDTQKELDEIYYDESIDQQKAALDTELENYKADQENKITLLQESLTNEEELIKTSLQTVQDNHTAVYDTLTQMGDEYGIQLSGAIVNPWIESTGALATFTTSFDEKKSHFSTELGNLKTDFEELGKKADETANKILNMLNQIDQSYKSMDSSTNSQETPKKSGENEKGSNSNKGSKQKYQVLNYFGNLVKEFSSYEEASAWVNNDKNLYIRKLAKGTRHASSGLAWVNEQGPEAIFSKTSTGSFHLMNEGDQVFTKQQTDNLYRLSTAAPSLLLSAIASPALPGTGAYLQQQSNSPTNIDIKCPVYIQGSVDNQNIQKIQKQIDHSILKAVGKLNQSLYKSGVRKA